ncbi:MAG: tetratricopeptide repeat protein [Lachnospiraceae bacterium]|nr:tetratricopeptide repeat protein [Lachnospiraceae bacterium]
MWEILGIEQTKDKDLIKKAYRDKLVNTNPEDDQEGFMKLREAYEEALRYSDTDSDYDDSYEEDEGGIYCPEELKKLHSELKELYKDFNKRIDEKIWTDFLNEDEFIMLDTSTQALELLIAFLMEHFLLPSKIWRLIIDTFYIKDRRRELIDKFPEDFISYIIEASETPDCINYYLFDDNDDDNIDNYIRSYHTLNSLIRKGLNEDAEKLFEELKNYNLYHPYIELIKIRISLMKLKADSDVDEIKKLYTDAVDLSYDCPKDFNVLILCGDLSFMLKNYDDAERYYNDADETEPGSYIIQIKKADLDLGRGEYERARDIYLKLLRENNYDNAVRTGMLRANYKLIENYEKRLREYPEDNDTRLELAWSMYQSYRFEDAVKVLDEFVPREEKTFEYYNVKGRCYLCLLNYDNALSCFFKWKEAIESLLDDDSEESQKQRKRYPYVNCLIGDCYLKQEKYDEARKYLNIAISQEHDEIVITYEALCELEYKTGHYETCINTCEKLLEYNEINYIAYDYMASSCMELKFIKEALDACEKAIRIYPFAPDPYLKEINIFNALNNKDAVKNIIKKYKSLGVSSDKIRLEEANVLLDEGKYDEALEILLELEEIDKKESDLDDNERVYSLISLCYVDKNMPNEAVNYLRKIIKLNRRHPSAYGRIGVIHRKFKHYDMALSYLTEQISINPHPYFYQERGVVHRCMGNYKEAIRDFAAAVRMDPKNVECYRSLAFLYERIGDYPMAVMNFDSALKYTEKREEKARLIIEKIRVLQCENRFSEAKVIYEEYIEEFGLNADVIYDYSELLQRMNEIENAINIIKDNLDKASDDKEEEMLLRKLCTIYGEEGYINMANETFRVIINKFPKDFRAYKLIADILKDHGLYDDATEYYQKAIELDINGTENYYSSLVENEYSKKTLFKPDMKNEIKKALELGTKTKTIVDYIKLARIYRVTKKYKLAVETINKGVSQIRCYGCFYSGCHELFYEKGLIYEAMKKYDMARNCYKKALSIKGHCTQYEECLKRIDGK